MAQNGSYGAAATVAEVARVNPPTAVADGWQAVCNPADTRDQVGWVRPATVAEVELAASRAARATQIWQVTPPQERAACLKRAADLLEQRTQSILGLIVREAGKSLPNAISEIRVRWTSCAITRLKPSAFSPPCPCPVRPANPTCCG